MHCADTDDCFLVVGRAGKIKKSVFWSGRATATARTAALPPLTHSPREGGWLGARSHQLIAAASAAGAFPFLHASAAIDALAGRGEEGTFMWDGAAGRKGGKNGAEVVAWQETAGQAPKPRAGREFQGRAASGPGRHRAGTAPRHWRPAGLDLGAFPGLFLRVLGPSRAPS